MTTNIVHSHEFALMDLLGFTNKCNPDAKLYSSCMSEKYTLEKVIENCTDDFEAIFGLYPDEYNITAGVSDIGKVNKDDPISLKDVRKDKGLNKAHKIDREVDDGYSLEFYSTIIYNENIIVLL